MRHGTVRLWLALGQALVLVLAIAGPDARGAGGAAAELKTAIEHGDNSFKSETLKDAVWHLHHVLNCLEGPKSPLYDASAGNPCQGQGNGALADIQSAMGRDAEYWDAWWAANIAAQAVKMTTLAQVRAAAHAVTLILTSAVNMK